MESRFGRSINTALNAAAIPFALVAVIAMSALLLLPGPSSPGAEAAASGVETAPMQENVAGASAFAPDARCKACGIIESVREVRDEAEPADPGLRARPVPVVVASSLPGGETQSGSRYEVTVRMKDGSSRVISGPLAGALRRGKRVVLIDGSGGKAEARPDVKILRTSHRAAAVPSDGPPLSVSAVQLQRK